MLQKTLLVVNGLTGQETRIQATEGATPEDILAQLNLSDYRLARVRNRLPLQYGADITREVEDGERLFAFSPMEVGE